MKKEVTLPDSEFASQCERVLEQVATTGVPVVITHEGRPLVRIMAEPTEDPGRPSLAHMVISYGDVVSPIDEEWDAER